LSLALAISHSVNQPSAPDGGSMGGGCAWLAVGVKQCE
jgi:hypothetical protein